MTNGEKFKEVFGVSQVDEGVLYAYAWLPNHDAAEFSIDWWNTEYKEPTTKNDLGVDCIDRAELLKAMDTWDKFGNDPNEGLIPLRTPALQDRYVPYVKYEDMVKCVNGMPSVTPQEPKTGRWIANAPQYDMLNPQYICSECGNAHTRTTPYCEMCGAKMVEPQESEDKE